MIKVKTILMILILVLASGFLYSEPVLKLVSNQGTEFQVGDTFVVRVDLENNDGAYGVYFDLRYNNSVFELEDIIEGDLLPDSIDESELLVARGAYNEEGHLIVSNSLIGDKNLFYHNGTIVSLVFKTLQSAEDESIILESANTQLLVKESSPKAITINNLTGLNVIGLYTHYFVQIISPYNNYKTNINRVDFHVQGTINNQQIGDTFKIGLKRVTSYDIDAEIYPDTNEIIKTLESGQAYFQASDTEMFCLSPGYNYVTANLYVNDKLKSSCVKRIYYEEKGHGVRIISPYNNSITGKSIITIEGESTFKEVSINNINADVDKLNDEKYVFVYERQKLKEGFNKITARTINPDAPEIIYKDVIVVYYQRDESIFDFINPLEDSVFKDGKINIKGVIDTVDTGIVTVKMRCEFKPFGHNDDFRYVFRDTDKEDSQILLRDLENSENFLLSHYIFETDFDLSLLEGYGSGVLTFYAVKTDKTGKNQDIEIERSIYINSNKLEIDLRQPNLYNDEILNMKNLLEKYYNPETFIPEENNLFVYENGRITLDKKENSFIYDDNVLNDMDVKDVVLCKNGNYFSIVNSVPNRIEVYKKYADDKFYDEGSKRTYFNAFANCGVEFGNNNLLLGISDYNTSTNHPSGLVLYNNGLLRTAKFPFDINHVQYIRRIDDEYYLYASNYNYMYKFNESDVIINQYDDKYFEIKDIKKYYLPNNLFINGFEISSDGKTVVLATDLGLKIYRYNSFGNVYSLNKEFKKGKNITRLGKAELEGGYIVYMFSYFDEFNPDEIKISTLTETSSKNFIEKEYSGNNVYKEIYQIGKTGTNILYIYGKNDLNNIVLDNYEVFYGCSYKDSINLINTALFENKNKLLFSDENNFQAFGDGLTSFTEVYSENDGIIEFLVTDKTVDGIVGFSYQSPEKYEDLLEVSYILTDNSDDTGYIKFNGGGSPTSNPRMSLYEYKERSKYKYLKLKFEFKSGYEGLFSNFIENLTIKKQEIVKITGENLPVKGFIEDRTVGPDDFSINSKIISVEDNGSFYENIKINPDDDNKVKQIRLFATNKSGETDEIIFNIISVNNEPQISNVTMLEMNNNSQSVPTYSFDTTSDYFPIDTTSDTIEISGNYSGLYGVQVNCELYTTDSQNNISKFINSYNSVLSEDSGLEEGIMSGSFKIENVKLLPGVQRIILRCMNPAGTKKEVQFDINFDVVDQKIEITNYEIINNKIIYNNDSEEYQEEFEVRKNINKEYIRSFELIGRVITSNPVDHINFRSDNDYISFSKGNEKDVNYIKVELNELGKTFSVYVNLKMHDTNEELTEYFKMWPDSLQLSHLSQNVYVECKKIFEDISPDFSVSEMDNLTGEIDLKFKFNEPVPNNMMMRLRFNHKDLIDSNIYLPIKFETSNEYFNYADGIYSFKDPLFADHGFNIIEWWFYEDKEAYDIFEEDIDKLLGESKNNNFVSFDFDNGEEYTELKVVFPETDIYYDKATLNTTPLKIEFDARGELEVIINGILIGLADYIQGNNLVLDISQFDADLNQGINDIKVTYKMNAKNIDQTLKSTFKYDSIVPVVDITSVESLEDFVNPYVISVTCDVFEDNLKRVNLIYDDSVVNAQPNITILSDNKYVYKWENFTEKMVPSKVKTLYVEVIDITDKVGKSKIIDQNLWLYYEVDLSNNMENTQVVGHDELEITGTNDENYDFTGYWNEGDNKFEYHLKYESTDLTDDEGKSIREDITDSFSKEIVFNSDKKYLMFEFENEAGLENVDLGYRIQNKLTKDAAITPIDMLIHKGITTDGLYINAYNLDVTDDEDNPLYSMVEGFKTYESRFIGFAQDVLTYKNYAFVQEYVDQNNDGVPDYKAVIIYNLFTKHEDHTSGIPNIVDVIDYEIMQNIKKIKIYENFLYLICGDDGIVIYDIGDFIAANSSPKAMHLNTFIPVNEDGENLHIYDLVKKDNFIYVAAGDDGVRVFNASDLGHPKEVSNIELNNIKPISISSSQNYIFALSENNKLVKYNITATTETSTLSDLGSVDLPEDTGVGGKIWWRPSETTKIYVLPDKNSKIYSYYIDNLTPVPDGITAIQCNNMAYSESLGFLYSTNTGIKKKEIDGEDKTIDSDPCYGIAFYDSKIYAAEGKEGLKIISFTSSQLDEMNDTDNNNMPDGWQPSINTTPIIYNEGLVDFPFEISENKTKSEISKSFDNTADIISVDPFSSIIVKFEQDIVNNSASIFTVTVKLRNNGNLSKSYVVATDSPVDFTVGGESLEIITKGELESRQFKFEEFGLVGSDELLGIELTSEMFWAKDLDLLKRTDVCIVDAVGFPEMKSFSMPLTHAAFKIDNEIGDVGRKEFPLELFDPSTEMFVKTETGKVLVYFPIDNKVENNIIEEKFKIQSNIERTADDLLQIKYSITDYFTDTTKRQLYKSAICQDNQETEGADLTDLNEENSLRFEEAFNAYFTTRRYMNEGLESIVLGESTEELVLLNAPEKYKIYLTDKLQVVPSTNSERIDEKTNRIIELPRRENGAVSFWIRLEEEIPGFYNYDTKKFWDDYNSDEYFGKPVVSWGSDSYDDSSKYADANYRFVVKNDKIGFVQYRQNTGLDKKEGDYDPNNIIEEDIDFRFNDTNDYGEWLLVTLSWDYTGGLTLYLNDKKVNESAKYFNDFNFEKFLQNKIVFGDVGQDVDSFYYSIASPKVFNRTLDLNDVKALYSASNRLDGDGAKFIIRFNNTLYIDKKSGCFDNIVTDDEVYEDSINGKAFAVTNGIINYIPNDYELNKLHLSEDLSYNDLIKYYSSASYENSTDELSLIPGLDGDFGIYHLTDGGSSGLGIPGHESYTFFGTLLPGQYNENDVCIIKINGVEKQYPLKTGDFKFTFDGVGNVLNSIDIYFKHENTLKFKAGNFGFNIGRYKGNNWTNYPENFLHMRHKFHHQESVIVYHEGLYDNAWELNNEEIVILDSRLYKIGIENNKYYAILKTVEGDIRLDSDKDITPGLHQYAIVYDFSSIRFRFYIDGRLEAEYKGAAFSMPDSIGVFPEVFNLTIGGSLDDSIKCQGLIDEFEMRPDIIGEKELQDLYSKKSRMISIKEGPLFDAGSVIMTLENATDNNLSVKYRFDDNDTFETITLNSMDNSTDTDIHVLNEDFSLGNHKMIMDINNGSFIKRETYNFIVSYAPVIDLVDYESIIIKEDNKNIELKLERDVKTLFAGKNEFAELKLFLKGSTDEGIDANEVQVITEDRIYSNFGKYYRDNDYSTLSEEIKFSVPLSDYIEHDKIFYKVKAYYFDNPSNVFELSGCIKVLDIEIPEITNDKITNRPERIFTKIKGYTESDTISGILCNYEIMHLDNTSQEYTIVSEGQLHFNDEGKVSIYVYEYSAPGNYKAVFKAVDEKGNVGSTKDIEYFINETETNNNENNAKSGEAYITDFDLVMVDTDAGKAKFAFSGGVNNIKDTEDYSLEILNGAASIYTEDLSTDTFNRLITFPGGTEKLDLGNNYKIKAVLDYNGNKITKEISYEYYGKDVDIKITHGALGYISYNNVYFNWEGYLDGKICSEINYRYSIDNSPWGESSKDSNNNANNHVEFYNLDDGYHKFKVQAFVENEGGKRNYSPVASNIFIIDTQKPVIDSDKIEIKEVFDEQGIISHLEVIGKSGSVSDITLSEFQVNGVDILLDDDAGFKVDKIELNEDGMNTITFNAVDVLGNQTTLIKEYTFDVLVINYPPTIKDLSKPLDNEFVKYSPLTVYGRITDNIVMDDDVKIYVEDPYGRRDAVVNFDRTFFIENVKINPGNKFKSIKTVLKFVTEFPNGKKLIKEYPVYARDVIKPIELELSVHAVAGGADTTEVMMKGKTQIDNIASWSFDYDGDGVYEDEHFTNEKEITVYYRYSNVGMIHPRVRIITADNHIFSGDDTLIIHDKIIKADIKDIEGVKSLDIIEINDENDSNVDGFEYVYVLQKENSDNIIKRYFIEANKAVLMDNSSVKIKLNELNINNPRSLKVDVNGDIYVSTLYGGGSKLYKLVKTTGGYIRDDSFKVELFTEVISSFDVDESYVYISLEESADIVKYTKEGSVVKRTSPDMDNIIQDCQSDFGIEAVNDKLWLGDYKNQRVVCVSSDTLKLRDFFGEAGSEEGEFISPKIVRVNGNFIFVLDQSEYTLQVFEQVDDSYRIICRVDNVNEYLPSGYMNNIADFTTFTKLENTKEYHYIALANSEYEQIALLRIPQWEPNSIRVRSNLVIYTRNNEIFTSKPDGADARKIFSSGSLPGVDGNVDYPSIGPDGTLVTFVSRLEKYEYSEETGDFVFKKYDKLYLMNADGTECRLVDDELIKNKEIERPQFSFNGSKIVFSAKGSGGYWAIYEYDVRENKATLLFNPDKDCMRPTYSPDDRYIAYVAKYFSHTEILIYDRENPDLIVNLTNNDYADDYPVWAPVYEGETDIKEIKSKIAFITKPDFTEKIRYTYIAQATSGDFRIVTDMGADVGNDPDSAANDLENLDYSEVGVISYPCFTADGKDLIFEAYKDSKINLMQYDMKEQSVARTGIPTGSRRPSGMKNRIVNFDVKTVDGNDLELSWDRYAKEDLIYTVTYKSSRSDANWVEKNYTSQNRAKIEDLEMGLTYYIRVYVKDLLRGGEVTTSILKKVVVFPVIAKPIIEIDENNPYLVRLKAWKPETDEPWEYSWKFKWFIDNYKVEETLSNESQYIFNTTGTKRIALEASEGTDSGKVHRSDDYFIDIIGDLTPVIEYELIQNGDNLSIRLDGSKSSGTYFDNQIADSYSWKISGSNINTNLPPEEFTGMIVTRNLDAYKGNINVTLTIVSKEIMGSVEKIYERKSKVIMIPLGLREIKPVITETVSEDDATLFTFDASQSVGNIDWTASTWEVYGPNIPEAPQIKAQGKSSFIYNFPEINEDTNYTVVFNARNKATGNTTSVSKLITVGKVPVVPVIDYKVITTEQSGEIVTAKLLLSAASSKGNDIDWNTVKWDVPLAGDYGGTSSQTGATAVYNLYNIKEGMAIDVNLTIQRRTLSDIIETSEIITIKNNEVPQIEPYIELVKENLFDLYETEKGDTYIFNALNSKGANIDWNKVTWLIDGQYTRQGSVVRYDAVDSGEDNQSIVVTLTLQSLGGGIPVSKTMSFNLKRQEIDIVISKKIGESYIEADKRNIVRLSVKDSIGRNIDWERTRWFIYQGPEDIVEKYGADIIHTFPLSSQPIEYYPVSVQMFYKGSTKPFVKQTNVRVNGDNLKAIIKEETGSDIKDGDQFVRTFSAADSLGENIDWQSCKWSFGDSSEYQYGPVVTHKFPVDNQEASYMIALTIQRKTKAGKTEIDTDTYKVEIGEDELNGKITVTREGNYVLFSAEESEGRGLMLDRTVWLFEGSDSENSGDSETDISHKKKNVYSTTNSIGFEIGTKGVNTSTGVQFGSTQTYLQDGSISQSSGESSNNIYTGAACRKMIDGSWDCKIITLIVYRTLSNGTFETQTKTFKYVPGYNDNVTIE